MPNYTCIEIINENERIGDSLSTINDNFQCLDTNLFEVSGNVVQNTEDISNLRTDVDSLSGTLSGSITNLNSINSKINKLFPIITGKVSMSNLANTGPATNPLSWHKFQWSDIKTSQPSLWNDADKAFIPEIGKQYLINFNVQFKGSNTSSGDNHDFIIGILRDGQTSRLGGKTAFWMDRTENQDHVSVQTYNASVPLWGVTSADKITFYGLVDRGRLAINGTFWITEFLDDTF